MGAVHSFSEPLSRQAILIGSLSPTFTSRLRFSPRLSAALPKRFCTIPNCSEESPRPLGDRSVRVRVRVSSRVQVQDTTQLKENWLDSLSCPFPAAGEPPAAAEDEPVLDPGSGWVVGIDPDSSGALALIKPDSSAQVFDTPYLQVLVGKKVRKRLDARSIVQLLHSFGAPLGTTAYIEQSNPFPKDGKQGWWSGGFTYGLWLGVLVATGFSVVPVSPRLWKDRFELCGSSSTKDDSRTTASVLFPSLSTSLKRKKDHGRAEALLIAAYGKGLRIQPSPCAVQSF